MSKCLKRIPLRLLCSYFKIIFYSKCKLATFIFILSTLHLMRTYWLGRNIVHLFSLKTCGIITKLASYLVLSTTCFSNFVIWETRYMKMSWIVNHVSLKSFCRYTKIHTQVWGKNLHVMYNDCTFHYTVISVQYRYNTCIVLPHYGLI